MLLDSAPDARFDRITRLAQRLFGTAIALVSLVSQERQWFLSRQGLAAQQTGRDVSFCGHAILGEGVLVVEDALADARFADNPLVLGAPGIRFYAGVPLHGPAGWPIGTLCVIDTAPRRFEPAELASLQDLGELVEGEIGAVAMADSRRAALLSQARLGAILDNILDGIVTTDAAGRIESMNPAALRMFGYAPAQMLGSDLRELLAPSCDASWDDLLSGRHCHSGLRADGSVFPMELSITPVASPGYQGYAGVVRDISARRRAEDVQGLFSAIVASSADAVVSTTLNGVLTSWNPAAEAMYGYPAEQVLGQPAAMLSAPGQEDEQAALLLRVGRGEAVAPLEMLRVRADGSQFPVSLTVSPVRDASGAIVGAAEIARDISELRRRERELLAAKRHAEQANQAKSDFLANMSHEIRTPLNAVLGLSHLMGSTELSADQRNYLDMIESSSQSLLRILNDILDFSKIEAGLLMLEPARMLLADLLRPLATTMAVNAGEKELDLLIGVAPGVPTAFVADTLRLQQILLNLVGNAIKFTEAGQVALLVDCPARDATQATLRLRVRDSGIGISAEQQSQLFQPFSQADTSITRRFGGTGLGLSIARRLAALMGGTIEIDSTPGRGSEFCLSVRLPLAAPAAPLAPPLSGAVRALLVSSDDEGSGYLATLLGAWGWPCVRLAEVADALALLRDGAGAGVLLIDLQSVGSAGLALAQAVKNQLAPARRPLVLVLVNNAARGMLLRAEAAAIDAFVHKPYTEESLRGAVLRARGGGADGLLPSPLTGYRGQQHRIDASLLLVEDNQLNQVVACNILRRAGARLDVASNGLQALAMLRAAPERYQLVLMDIQMPLMDGISATRAIRQELGLRLPVLAMTAGVLERERERCAAAGMDDFIAKPLNVEQMFATILRHLPGASASASASAAAAVAAVPMPVPAPLPLAAPAADQDADFDLSQLLCGDDDPAAEAALAEVVGRILADAGPSFEAARAAWRGGQFAQARAGLHTLRGTVGNLGAARFTAAARALESALVGDAAPPEELVLRTEQALAAALAAGTAWLAAQPAWPGSARSGA